jgi:hypothetical protein
MTAIVQSALILTASGLLLYFVLSTGANFSYAPSYEETVAFVLSEMDEARGNFTVAPGFQYEFENIQVTQSVSDVAGTHLVLGTYTLLDSERIRRPTRCYFVKFVTRYWLTGTRTEDSFGWQCQPTARRYQQPIILQSYRHESGDYITAGMVLDSSIAAIKVLWQNGYETIVPVVDETFLDISHNGSRIESVVGLDNEEREIAETLTPVSATRFAPLGLDSFRETPTNAGVMILGAYTERIAPAKECFVMAHLTSREAASYYSGEAPSNWQSLCFEPQANQTIGPPLMRVVNGTTVAGGLGLDLSIQEILIEWSDGWQQRVPVVDGLYFVQRPGQRLSIVKWGIID